MGIIGNTISYLLRGSPKTAQRKREAERQRTRVIINQMMHSALGDTDHREVRRQDGKRATVDR